MSKKIKRLLSKKGKSKIVSLTAYSKSFAKILDKYCDIILVGDSMANVLYGMKNTHKIQLNTIIQHSISVKKGIKKIDAQKYITSLFLALSEDAVVNSKNELKYLVKDSQTPKGLNEQGLKEMKKKGVYKSVVNTLNSIHKRLNK